MKALNIHGYEGSAHNSAYAALDSLGFDIVSPQSDYAAEAPESVIEKLLDIATEEKPDIIVGTSLGGFFASVLAARTGLPVMLVNPCLMPFLHLPRLGYGGDIAPFMKLFPEIVSLRRERVRVIVGGKDEVIDTHDFDARLFGEDNVRLFPEGLHSGSTLPLTEFFGKAAAELRP